MGDEFQLGNNNNWWDSSRNSSWPSEMVDTNNNKAARYCSGVQESTGNDATATCSGGGGGGALTRPNLHIMMGLGLSSQPINWNINQPVFRDNEKADNNSSFRSTLEEGMNSNTYFHHQESVVPSTHWRPNLYTSNNPDDSSTKRRAFSLDQPYNDTDAPSTTYDEDPSMFEGGLLASDSHHHQQLLQPSSYQTSYNNNDLNNSGDLIMMPRIPNKFPEFIVRGNSPPKQQQALGQLQFSNSTPFWNATSAAINDNVRSSSFFPSLQTPTFDQIKRKNASEEIKNSGVITVKKSSSETSNKRPRNESSSPLPALKVRKEKMGDRINALQQLVSPFGKTDTASVLSEAIQYIKFLHEQVNVLSTPYIRNGASVQNQQHPDNRTKDTEAKKQDLRSRGLCLVPVSSTFPVTHESTLEFYTPTFGGTFR